MANTLKVKQVKSVIGRPQKHRKTLKGLGLTKMHKVVTLEDTPSIRGMIFQVRHLVEVVEE